MVTNAKSKDNIYPYDALNQNSNTLVDTILREAGLREPQKDNFREHWAPDSENQLDRNLKPREPSFDILLNPSNWVDLSLQDSKPKTMTEAEKFQVLVQVLKNDHDGSFTAKVLAENPQAGEKVEAKIQEQQQQLALAEQKSQEQSMPQNQVQERSFGGRMV